APRGEAAPASTPSPGPAAAIDRRPPGSLTARAGEPSRGVMGKTIFLHPKAHRELADGFEQKYESIWVTPPNDELCDPERVEQYYKWNLDELELADRLGFDGVGVNEHHQNGYGFMASPNIMGPALARPAPNHSAIFAVRNT